MIRQELTLAELYLFLSKRYSAQGDFWLDLQRDELKHAQWVDYLKTRAMAGTAFFYEDKVRPVTVQTYIDYVNSTIKKFKTTKMSLKAALALAADIEGAMLDQKVFQHFEGDDPELVKTLNQLSAETAKHLKKVKDMWRDTGE